MDNRCGRCVHFSSHKFGEGECRHSPPTAVPDINGERQYAKWPLVDEYEWCGQFTPSEAEMLRRDISRNVEW